MNLVNPTEPSALHSGDAFRKLVSTRLSPLPARGGLSAVHSPSDFDLNPGAHAALGAPTAVRAAAVLVPVIARDPLTVLLTRRTDHLTAHAGQIAFPGGKVEHDDEGPLATALREAEEEVGIAASFIEPLGFLDNYRTGTDYLISPVVALVIPAFQLRLDPHEVAGVFEVPLGFLMDAANHRRDARVIAGSERHFHAMPYGEHYIWGATAGILKNMHERLFAP